MLNLPDLNILVVDDNSMDRLITKSILLKLGIRAVQEAENGSIAAGKIETAQDIGKPYDLVFMDWNMPASSGLKLLQMLHKDVRFKGCKVIVMTSTSDKEIVQDAIKFGATDFIVKPVTFGTVKEKLERLK